MKLQQHILLFHGESADLVQAVQDLVVRSRTNIQLHTLLADATEVIRQELDAAALYSSDGREGYAGNFEDVLDLTERHADRQCCSHVIEMALLATCQVAELLVFAEADSSILSNNEGLMPIGLGSGLLTAAVAAAAGSTKDILVLGLEAVKVSIHLALAIEETGKNIEDTDASWSRVLSGFTIEDVETYLAEVNSTLHPLSQAYIGQSLLEEVAIFGPPSTLCKLSTTTTAGFKQALPIILSNSPARAPLYGPHLPPVNTSHIVVDHSSLLGERVLKRPLWSSHCALNPIPVNQTLTETFCMAAAQVAHHRSRTDQIIEAVATRFEYTEPDTITVHTLGGSTHLASHVRHELEKLGHTVHLGQRLPLPKPFGNGDGAITGTTSGSVSVSRHEIAVVGMAGRFPESDTLNEFWNLLESGETTHREIPSSRFSVDDFYDPTRTTHNALLAHHGCFIKKPGNFDHRLFNISPREALQMDPVQRMLLMTTYEALEMAGYSPPRSRGDDDSNNCTGRYQQSTQQPRIATYFGQTVDDWKTINDQQGIDTHYLPGVNRSFAPGRIGHYFQWAGGFYSIDTGCSSSATALCLAREALASGECDAAVVGGGTLLNAPEWFAGLSQGGFLSPTGACKTYSDAADGYCRGEGVAVIVLKRIADAVRSNDNVLAVVSGAARNCNAGAGSITYPGEEAQVSLYRRVLRQAGIHPHDVGFVEMHGTGTQAGDKVEMRAVQRVFAPSSEKGQQKRHEPLIVGAVKACMGHSEAAAGVVSLIKAILMLQRNLVPPQPDQPFTLNPNLVPLLGNEIQLGNSQAWHRKGDTPRYILVNNFDAAGGNVSLILHDAPSFAQKVPVTISQLADEQQKGPKHHVVVNSGRTVTALEANKRNLHKYLSENPKTNLANLAYTTTSRRIHQVKREAYVVTSIGDLCTRLQQSLVPDKVSEPASSVVFAFTGQGSQHLGMGSKLFSASRTFRGLIESYQSLCDVQGLDCQLLNVISGGSETQWADKPATECDMQVATVALEIALAKYWQGLGLCPTMLIGHSLGEYAALCIAGVLSVSHALALACERATLISSRCPPGDWGMLAIGLPPSTVQRRLRNVAAFATCEVTCFNGPSSTVVGGPMQALGALEGFLKSDDGSNTPVTRLPVQHGFHTGEMDAILDELEASASRLVFHPPTLPVVSTLLGRVVQPGEQGVFDADYIRRHTRMPVSFMTAVQSCQTQGLINNQTFVVEIGPHPTCVGLIKSCLPGLNLHGYPSLRRGHDDEEFISQCLAAAHCAQLPVSWDAFHRDHDNIGQLSLIANLPTYAFDYKEFWHTYKTGARSADAPPPQQDSPSTAGHLSSTCLHSVLKLCKQQTEVSATFHVDLKDKDLSKAIGGHIVDGVAICPASIFMDMAYTAALFLGKESDGSSAKPLLAECELAELNIGSPLVLRDGVEPPLCVVNAVLDKSTKSVSVRFLSQAKNSKGQTDHGSCIVQISQAIRPATWEWSRMRPLVKARVASLHASLRPRHVHAMDKSLFYKIFSEIVDYSSAFHAVEEATVASDFHDAAFIIQPQAPAVDLGSYTCSPFIIDALIHVAGFLLNADVRKPKHEVHIANHIGSLRILGDLTKDSPFLIYATIREQDLRAGTSLCDVYMTNSQDSIVAICTDICFKKLDRGFFALLTGSTRAQPPARSRDTGSRTTWLKGDTTPSSTPSFTPGSEVASTTRSSISGASDLYDELLEIIAKWSGISVAELQKAMRTNFAELGLDSQMSISILADFQKSTAVELPAAFFTNFPTLDHVRQAIDRQNAEVEEESGRYSRTTGVGEKARVGRINKQRDSKSSPSEKPVPSSTHLLRLVTDALGLQAEDLKPWTKFESVGMDSMMSIRITTSFQQETGIELAAAFFSDHPTVAAAREALDGSPEPNMIEKPPSSYFMPSTSPSITTTSTAQLEMQGLSRQGKIDKAISRAVLIQGDSRSRDAPLFMTTDGSGTVESYIHLSALPNGRRIYALESPFVMTPETFDLSIQEMASIFIRAIRKIQPHGPYLIGGWSAGGIYAYEVAYRLTMQSEKILAYIVLDMRAPSLIPTSIVTVDFVEKLGTFEGINRARDLPQDLSIKERTHLMATCRALAQYDAPAFPVDRRPRHVAVVWARLGLDNRQDGPPAAMGRPGLDIGKALADMTLSEFEQYFNSWFYGRREQFGMNGWETLLGDHIAVHCVDGDHFSMMCPPFSTAVGSVVADTVMIAVGDK
ncbi:Type I Iterative PKS [Claviceps pazoutovae]|uniref:Type I Iterative PKS n=1 Tax=Claviceps pazoutovae TaxID=1649127 RepID=A0A9P7SGP4_9HYPO|nr:Type I Iterative PKS [Claviceps pazoutovae]